MNIDTTADLDFYLDRGCVVVPCRAGRKEIRAGAGQWTAEDSRSRRDELAGNAAMRNGTGGLLVVDIDAKHGGSVEDLVRRFPGIDTGTRTVRTVSMGERGPGLQLVYTLPDGFKIRPVVLEAGESGPRVEVAAFAMLPGSRARGAKTWEQNPPMRVYSVVNDTEPVRAPVDLLAAVEAYTFEGSSRTVAGDGEPGTARAQLGMLTSRLANAGDGERNQAWTAYALPIVRQCEELGEDAETVLTMAYEQSGGTDESWIRSAIRPTLRTAETMPAGAATLGPYALDRLIELETWARFAPWPGVSGPTDRRVLLAVVRLCLGQNLATTGYGKRTIALCAGLSEDAVEVSLERLENAGRLEVVDAGGFKSRSPMLGLDDTTHTFPPLVSEDIYNPDLCMPVDALSAVWSVPSTDHGVGLAGRHGQLFDLVCAGLDTARALGDYIGSRPDTMSRVLKRLVETGLLTKNGTAYAPAPNAGELAQRLALDLGGYEVCARREDRYRTEAARYEESRKVSTSPAPEVPGSWPDPFALTGVHVGPEEPAEGFDFGRRRLEAEQELYEQVGLPHG